MEDGDWESLAVSAERDRNASTPVTSQPVISGDTQLSIDEVAKVDIFSLRGHWARVETRRDEAGRWRAHWCLFGRKDDAAGGGDVQRLALVVGITAPFQVECDARLHAEADASVTERLLAPLAMNVRMCAGVPTSALGMSSPLVPPRMASFVCACDDYDYRIDWIRESDHAVHWSAVISYDGRVVGWPTGRVLAPDGVGAVEALLRRAMQDTIHAGIEAFAAYH